MIRRTWILLDISSYETYKVQITYSKNDTSILCAEHCKTECETPKSLHLTLVNNIVSNDGEKFNIYLKTMIERKNSFN